MTVITRIVRRETASQGVFERGKYRAVIITLDPPNVIGFRLKGTRTTYRLTAEGCYWMAIAAAKLAEKRAKQGPAKTGRRKAVKRGMV